MDLEVSTTKFLPPEESSSDSDDDEKPTLQPQATARLTAGDGKTPEGLKYVDLDLPTLEPSSGCLKGKEPQVEYAKVQKPKRRQISEYCWIS